MSMDFNYDKIMEKVGFKYVVPIMVAKRVQILKDEGFDATSKPLVETSDNNLVTIAFKEIEKGHVRLKNKDRLSDLKPEVK
ncbi:DNA-directed RNA polymerase subunit omega [Marinitoga sp. 1135]|uniref:DNA-directed RNA polymerase subunit omega n=1 Tax=Marinitoga piezophila (strain DSM 14283 / JCM 11233 / KA3) TaxID=443254 RepID=H2J4K5_MARPK|nr:MULTISPECIES: DNA-directed RNA polymerase subunit omega [Marinitoga]AEX85947.1 DNA-directed RNA polymerase, subunit K/omega [Marinitoga piezophila KA3]APT76375.1 DNA-directed RNA polymerase subunit omega [Marinitoga sp. 1137]NUU96145.1 DNA-directed RNA polymerase subunit omega [Marinitoga sp. 1135]NUU98053.1 DNA-directed RNA polymerase subunit omega [Marinitoga sp. 1138]